jgi:hypothetical protein
VPREVVPGISTRRIIPGHPYELAGKRIAFTNWYYVDPGDLDWVNKEGKSVYVKGNEAPGAARFKGVRTPHGIRLRAHRPDIRGPMEVPHRCVLQVGDRYHGWSNDTYFQSTDGASWTKVGPLKLDKAFTDGVWNIFIDPSAPAAERYKTVWTTDSMSKAEFDEFRRKHPDNWEPRALLHYSDQGDIGCIRGGYSADGITWNAYPDPLVVEYSDSLNTAYYDTDLKRYVLYTRQWSVGPRSTHSSVDIRNGWTDVGRRAIGRSESADFRTFPPSELIVEPTPDMLPSEVLYTNCHTFVPGAPDCQLMFPAIWNASVSDTTRIAMLSSHDGKIWHWIPGGDILATQEPGKWNGGCIWALPNLIELPDKSWALPYLAHTLPHKYPRGQQVGSTGYAVWPKGRMVSIDADDEGEFYTIPVVAKGSKLKINALTTAAGRITVEVTGVDGHKLKDCDAIIGDALWTTVTWNGKDDLGIKEGADVGLRIHMKQAQLFGVEFE